MQTPLDYVQAGLPSRRLGKRQEVDFILEMSAHLARRDRVLIEQVYRHGQPVSDTARLARVNIRTMQKQLSGTVKRMYSREFQYILAHESVLPRRIRAVARRMVLEGCGLRETARLTGYSLHHVRQQHVQITAILASHTPVWSPPAGSPALFLPTSFPV